jgi:hypothetical protein
MASKVLWATLLLTGVLVSSNAYASNNAYICGVYQDTRHAYHFKAISITGMELNSATNSMNYNYISHYIVIFWAPDEGSAIEMQGISLNLHLFLMTD